MDTIFALSTVQGKSGVAIIRISGPRSLEAIRQLAGDIPDFRKASVRLLRTVKGDRLDEALILTFDAGKSFTGELSAEIQCHGSMAIISAILSQLQTIPGLRLAETGEFTRRALENGRLDLAQVEGLADLIDAETEAQRRQALRVFSGELGQRTESWRVKLIRAVALIEATIDFADEEVPQDVSPEVSLLLEGVIQDLESEIQGVGIAERVRSGFEVAIVGSPNVGKSTLLNALAGREAAITSEIAGTTRDVIEVRMDLDGIPVTFLDTAGLRDAEDEVEAIGIDRARKRADLADIRVFLIQDDQAPPMQVREGDVVRMAKIDKHASSKDGISGLTGEGVSQLMTDISHTLKGRIANVGIATRFRHEGAMTSGLEMLQKSLDLLRNQGMTEDIVAEELHSAIRVLDSLVGRVDIESVLDEIFSSFCLGK